MSKFSAMQMREAKFRGKTSSKDMNETNREILFSMNDLFQIMGDTETQVENALRQLYIEKEYQKLTIARLENELAETKSYFQSVQNNTGSYRANLYPSDCSVDGGTMEREQASILQQYHQVTLPVSGNIQQKLVLFDTISGETVIPDTLYVELEPAANSQIVDTNLIQAFSSEHDKMWIRTCTYDEADPTATVEAEMTITLPDTIISSRDINTLLVRPFPVNNVGITKVEYRMDGEWLLLPGWQKDGTGEPIARDNAGNFLLYFGTTAISQLRITFIQDNFIVEDNKKIFYLGAQEISLGYSDVQTSTARFLVSAKLPSREEGKRIKAIIPHFANETALADNTAEKRSIFQYSLYTVDRFGNKQYTKDSLPVLVTEEEILLKATLSKDSKGVTPSLSSIEIIYEDAL